MPRPALKISVVRKGERGAPREKPTYILAFWENDDGRLSGQIEKGVRLFLEVEVNGEKRRGEITAGRNGLHWINAHDDRERVVRPPQEQAAADDVGPLDF